MVRLCAGLVLVLLLGGTGVATAESPVVDLGTLPGGSGSAASDVNKAGVVVGTAVGADGLTHAVRWDRRGVITDLGANAEAVRVNAYGEVAGTRAGGAARWGADGTLVDLGTLPGGQQSWAVGINDDGVVAGNGYHAMPTGQILHALRWNEDGVLTDLGAASAGWSEAYGMNAAGVVVGVAATPDGPSHAARWSPTGELTFLEPLPGSTYSIAYTVSDAGVVVGQALTGGTYHAVRWDRQGVVTDLGTLPGGSYSTAGSTSGGMVAGTSAIGAELYPTHAVRWDGDGITDLGVLPGAFDSSASRVNRRGTVIGRSGSFAVWWDRQGQIHQLAGPDWTYAAAINDRDVVVGTAGGFAALWRVG